mmetsp:Transcript_9735/g.16401  ORF Transcript_9735/g.16401 Transcript_9735/m.16401 type:complete len:318 (+) Transcript_9735:37-990(+)
MSLVVVLLLLAELVLVHFDYDVLLGGEELLEHGPVDLAVEEELEAVLGAGVADEGLLLAEVLGGHEDGVEADLEGVLEHVGDEAGQEWAAQLETGVGVDLDEVGLELVVDHEVEAEDLHGVEAALGVEFAVAGAEDVRGHLVHLGEDVALKADVQVGVALVDELLEVHVGELVAGLELAVVLGALLHGVVGEVDQLVAEVVDGVLAAGGAQVALLVDEHLGVAVDRGHQHVGADVELAAVDEQRVVDVLLDDAGALGAGGGLLDQLLDLGELLGHLDAVAAVGVFARLDDPDVLGRHLRGVVAGLLGRLAQPAGLLL